MKVNQLAHVQQLLCAEHQSHVILVTNKPRILLKNCSRTSTSIILSRHIEVLASIYDVCASTIKNQFL
jgi:hypothetical protein